MIWQTHEQQSSATLDEPMAEALGDYLDRKESLLSRQIRELVSIMEGVPSLTLPEVASPLRLNEAVEEFSRKIRKASQSTKKPYSGDSHWKEAVAKLNKDLWGYVEVLEGCVTELFQQLEQIGFEHWNVDLARAMTSMKDELTHRIDEVTWAIRRLEEQLKAYRRVCESREGKWVGLRKIFFSWQSLLDRTLEPTLRKCNKFLNFRYRKFIERYTGYLQLYDSAQKQVQKFYNFKVLSSLDLDQQDRYKHLYLLLRLWEQNNTGRILPRTETMRAVRSLSSYPVIVSLFKEYYSAIRKAVFDKSRMIKNQFRLLFTAKNVRQPFLDSLETYRAELGMLSDVITKYHKFCLHTDPKINRSLLHKKSNEEHRLDELQHLVHEIENLDLLVVNFHSSLECDPAMESKITPELQNEINRNLHEMEQPLASQDLMRRDAKNLLDILHGLDEMGSYDPEVVEYVRKTLVKSMCADWKYHVLQGLPLFHHIYQLHQGICSEEDRAHMGRFHKFQRILSQLTTWMDRNETLKYAHDIELDINDLKVYFQDFLAHVQRLEKKPEDLPKEGIDEHPVAKAEQALLEYLYLFGNFFHKLKQDNPDQRLIRKKLLFVDQYFEEIERKLKEAHA